MMILCFLKQTSHNSVVVSLSLVYNTVRGVISLVICCQINFCHMAKSCSTFHLLFFVFKSYEAGSFKSRLNNGSNAAVLFGLWIRLY